VPSLLSAIALLRCPAMRRLLIAAAVVAVAGLATATSVAAADLRSCGKLSGWSVHAERATTTCGLARSATRDFLRKLGEGHGTPESIIGRSPKSGRGYRLTLRFTVTRPTSSASMYAGRAGDATLRVRITGHLY
jgi:hypothetical protein